MCKIISSFFSCKIGLTELTRVFFEGMLSIHSIIAFML
jgi:hypothetical protein